MTRSFLFCFVGFILWSCNSIDPNLQKDKEIILVRKIGHEIMRYTGDSTSSISPVKELGSGSYQLDFEIPFSFVSDTIINIIDQEIKYVSSDEYIVKVNSCSLDELVFSYFISPVENNDLVSCLGRNQNEDCYNIQLTFLHDNGSSRSIWILTILGIISLISLLTYILKRKSNKTLEPKKNLNLSLSNDLSKVNIGLFEFNYEEQYLFFSAKKISLTYKEAKILRILNQNLSEVVTRETLLKEVWEDEGLMVSRSLDMFISKLRKKLKVDSNVQIINIHGIGYKLIAS